MVEHFCNTFSDFFFLFFPPPSSVNNVIKGIPSAMGPQPLGSNAC